MFKSKRDKELESLSPDQLSELSLEELQRIRNKRWAFQKSDLKKEAEAELARRNPMRDWSCLRCGKDKYHSKPARVASSLADSYFDMESSRYHVVICNYCGKSEFYSVLREGSMVVDLGV